MILTVATGHIGDIPDSIRTGSIHDRTTCERVGETFRSPLRVVLVVTAVLETTVPESRVQSVLELTVRCLFGVLVNDVLVRNSIEQTGTIDADGVLQLHLIALALQQTVRVAITLIIDIHRLLRHVYFGVTQFVGLAIGELVSMLVGRGQPSNGNHVGVERSLKGLGTE